MKIKFAQKAVEKLVCQRGKQRADFFDTESKGLLLELRASGQRSYFLRYRDCYGRQRQIKLGDAGDLSVRQARLLAVRLRADIAMGVDPLVQKAERRGICSFREFFTEYYLPHARVHKRSWALDESLFLNHLSPFFGDLPMDRVSTTAIAQWVQERRTVLSAASVNRILSLLKHCFSLALRWETPGVLRNPTEHLSPLPVQAASERFLSTEDASRLLSAIQHSENPMLQFIVPWLLLTGARKREALDARWEDIAWERKVWRIPKTKSGQVRYVPLSEQALSILRIVPREPGCAWIFPNLKTKRPYVSFFFAWNTARCKAGLPDLRVHDLRHSFASFLVNAGESLYVVQRLLGHSQIATTQRYAHLSQQSLLNAVNRVGEIAVAGHAE